MGFGKEPRMDDLKQKIKGLKRRLFAKFLRSNIVTFISLAVLGAALTSFILFSTFANINLLREQKRLEDYKSLKLVEAQINGVFKAEFDRLTMLSMKASSDLTKGSTKAPNDNSQIWIPDKTKSDLIPIDIHRSNSPENPILQSFIDSNWLRFGTNAPKSDQPSSILSLGNVTVLDGDKSVVFIVPIIGSGGALLGAVTSRIPATDIQSLLSEGTYLVNSNSTLSIGRQGTQIESINTKDPEYITGSFAARINVSESMVPWRVRSFHAPNELWAKPEIKETLNFHVSLMLITWVVIYLLSRSGIQGRKRQRTLIGNLAQKIIWITDEDGNVGYVIGKIRDHLGWKEVDYHDVEIGLFVHPEDRPLIKNAIEKAQTPNPGENIVEVRFENKDREYRWYEVTVTNMISVPEISGIVVTAHDIEHRKHATAHIIASKRAAEKANEAKSEFLSRMSHELRTPLNAILGFGQLLEMEAITDRQAENVDQILIAGRHLLDLVNDILDIARIETRKVNLSVEEVDIQEVIRESCALLAPLAAKSQVTLIVDESDVWNIMSDRQRLKQIVLNLLSNGVKYNRAGGDVSISIRQDDQGVSILFTDTGIGIEPQYIDRVFTPFDRLGSETAQVEGTGLGLALSKTLVDAMGAKLSVSSEFGTGSVFSLSFPIESLVKPKADLVLESSEDVNHIGYSGNCNLKVLLVEDNIINLRYISKVIEKMDDVELMSAKEGGIGIELAKTHNPNLILLDLDLPDIYGIEVLKALIADPITAKTHIIVMSAETNPHVVETALAIGAHKFVTKPIDIASLFELFNEEKKAA